MHVEVSKEQNYRPVETIEMSQQIIQALPRLEKATNRIFELATNKAETERIYRVELGKEKMRLRFEEKLPISMIDDIARGNLAQLIYERDIARDLHKNAVEALGTYKTQVSAMQSVLRNHEIV